MYFGFIILFTFISKIFLHRSNNTKFNIYEKLFRFLNIYFSNVIYNLIITEKEKNALGHAPIIKSESSYATSARKLITIEKWVDFNCCRQFFLQFIQQMHSSGMIGLVWFTLIFGITSDVLRFFILPRMIVKSFINTIRGW